MKIIDAVYVYRLVGGERLSWHGRYHSHANNEFELHFFMEGSGFFLINRARYRIQAPQIFLSSPHEFHSIMPDSGSRPLSYYALLFGPETDEEGRPSPNDRKGLALLEALREKGLACVSGDTRDRFLLEDVLRLSKSRQSGERQAAAYLLLSLIYKNFSLYEGDEEGREAETSGHIPGREAKVDDINIYVKKALPLMSENLRNAKDVGYFARKLGISEEHLIRSFSNELGMTPFQYYTRLKVEAASGLLADSRMAVGAIANYFGFKNQFHFSRVFSKCTGLSPLAYRALYSRTAGTAAGSTTSPDSPAPAGSTSGATSDSAR